jgi:hypothetical protein
LRCAYAHGHQRSFDVGCIGSQLVFALIQSCSASSGTRTVLAPRILTVGSTPSAIHLKARALLMPSIAATSPPRSKSLSPCWTRTLLIDVDIIFCTLRIDYILAWTASHAVELDGIWTDGEES